jgi:hypothetical protein
MAPPGTVACVSAGTLPGSGAAIYDSVVALAKTAAEVEVPGRPISPHANLVTTSGLEALANATAEYRATHFAAMDQPEALADDIQAFFRFLRK